MGLLLKLLYHKIFRKQNFCVKIKNAAASGKPKTTALLV